MKALIAALALVVGVSVGGVAGGRACAQSAQDIPSAAPPVRAGESEEQHGRRLLDEMLKALGGDRWLNKQTEYIEGQTAPFFRGQPSGGVTRYIEYKQFAKATSPELARIEFVTDKGMIRPGTKRDVAQLWTADQGYELTFKGVTKLPELQVADYMRRRAHTLEAVMGTWVKAPGVIIVAEGIGTRDRHPIDKVSVLAANNDAVEIELDQTSHLPLQRSFEWRNQQFKDHDVDEEVYGDWRIFDGVATPMNISRYRNGDLVSQNFYTKVQFGQRLAPELFDKDRGLAKK